VLMPCQVHDTFWIEGGAALLQLLPCLSQIGHKLEHECFLQEKSGSPHGLRNEMIASCRARNGSMSNLAHLVSSAFNVREVPPLCTSSECNKARSRATSAADVHLVAQPVGKRGKQVAWWIEREPRGWSSTSMVRVRLPASAPY